MIHRIARAARQAALILLVAAALGPAPAIASGPYVVDDAAITPPGEGQIETWLSLTERSQIFQFLPATTFAALPFLEWTVGLDIARVDDIGSSGLSLQAKALFGAEPEAPGEVGWSVSGAVRFGLDGEGATDFTLNGITTAAVIDRLLVHANLGGVRNRLAGTSALTWGARAEAALIPDRLAVHGEVFGTSRSRAGFQLGLRPTHPDGMVDLEFIFSHNQGNERQSWATLGLAVRF